MSRSRRIVVGYAIALIFVVGLAAVGRIAFSPAMPNEWGQLRRGMSRDQVLASAGGKYVDMRDLKGFDLLTIENVMLGGPCYWQLHVTYDRTGAVLQADARFIHRRYGFLSQTTPRSVL